VIRYRGLAAFVIATFLVTPLASAQVPDWPTERPPRPLPAREVKFPAYAVKTLPNGLQVIAVSHHEQPAVSLRLIVRAGAAQDPANRPGTASLAATLLDQGTTGKSAEQIAQAIDSIGGALAVGALSDLTFINAAVMKSSLEVGMRLVSEVARQPAFAPQEVERQRQQVLSALKVSYEDPDYLASTVFDRLAYGFHPYGKPDTGTPASILALTRDDLVSFHKRYFGANNAILAVVGDVTHEEAFAAAQKIFGDWGKVDVTATASPADVPPPTRRVIVVDRPGAVQTEIRVGHVALPRRHKDYLALDIALKILGGEGGNRLHRVLRSERGLTYGASADMHALRDAGDFSVNTDTRSDSTGEVMRLISDEIWKLQRERVHPRELGDAQAYLTGSFPLTIETPSAIALQVLNAVFYGLDLEELQNYRERINAITPDDIQRVAKQYLHPDRLSIVLVGEADLIAKQLAAVGIEPIERIPLAELDLDSPDLRRKSIAPLVALPPEGGSHGIMKASWLPALAGRSQATDPTRALIADAIKAKGGVAALRALKTVKGTARTTFATPQGDRVVSTTTYVRYPGQFRVDAQGPEGLMVQTFDNGVAWMDHDGSVKDMPPPVASALRASVQRDTVLLFLALNDGRVKSRRVEDVVLGGVPCPALEVELAPAGPVTLVFDPKTLLLLSQRYGGSPGNPATEEVFLDYRDVQGIKVAHRIKVRVEGQPPIERINQTIDFNTPVDAALFQRPKTAA
jgi:zinc protease